MHPQPANLQKLCFILLIMPLKLSPRKLTFLEGGLRQEAAASSSRFVMETVRGCVVGVAPWVAMETAPLVGIATVPLVTIETVAVETESGCEIGVEVMASPDAIEGAIPAFTDGKRKMNHPV